MACNSLLFSHPWCMSGMCHNPRIPVMMVSRWFWDVQGVEDEICTMLMIHFSLSVEPGVATSRARISAMLSADGATVRAWIEEKSKGNTKKETSCMMFNVAQKARNTVEV